MGTGSGVEELLQGIVILFGKGLQIMDPPAASMLCDMTTLLSGGEGALQGAAAGVWGGQRHKAQCPHDHPVPKDTLVSGGSFKP